MKSALASFLGLVATLVICLGCNRTSSLDDPARAFGPAWFEDRSSSTNLDFRHDCGPIDGTYFMPQIVGSGAAWIDFDGDGLLDLYLLNNGGPHGKPNRLYHQRPDGTFEDVSVGSGLDVSGHFMGVAVGDANNDGRPDLVLTQFVGVRLFLNEGKGKFREVAGSGLENPLWGTSVAFLDYDRDGWLDLVVTNYLSYDPSWPCTSADGQRDYCAPRTFKGTSSKLFRNLGRSGGSPRFQDVSFESRIGLEPGPGLGVICADFNGDGWPDIFIANDGAPNHLWINQKDGKFKNEAVARGVALNAMGQPEGNMGIGYGDVDGDGLEDIFVTHLDAETNTLWKQGPRGLFLDVTASSGMGRPHWRGTGFGTVLADFDRDGSLDAAIINGAVARRRSAGGSPLGAHWGLYGQRNQVFRNDGTGKFLDVSVNSPDFSGEENVGRGLAVACLRNDGVPWLVATSVGGKARLLRGVAPDPGHWLVVRVLDPARKRDALGAEVVVCAGNRRWVRTAQASSSYLCSNDPRPHFGLGPVTSVDRVEVHWPDGLRERFEGGAVDRVVTLRRGEGTPLGGGKP